MIIDTLSKLDQYKSLNPLFPKAIRFLKRRDLARLADGRYEIDGSRVYAFVARGKARPMSKAKLEMHRKYIDIQVVLSGTDMMGWRARSECHRVEMKYKAKDDAELYRDPAAAWIATGPRAFTVFFPDDAHAPMVGKGKLHKVIVKVRA